MDVFISYSTVDDKFANAVAHVLKKNGISVWIASKDIYWGDEFPEEIRRAIEACKCMVVIASEHSNSSPHVENEIACASNLPPVKIVPYKIDSKHSKLEFLLSVTQWIDSSENKFEKIDVLIDAVRKSLNIEAPLKNKEHISNLNRIKILRKLSGKTGVAILAAQMLLVSWYLGNNFSVYFFALAVAFLLFMLFLIIWQRNKCFYRCCGRKKTDKVYAINDRNKKEYDFYFCQEHKHTFDMYEKLKPNTLIVYFLILSIAIIMGVFTVKQDISIEDFLAVSYKSAGTKRLVLDSETVEKAMHTICAQSQNTVLIKDDGSIYSYTEDIENKFAGSSLYFSVTGSDTHVISRGIDGSVSVWGDNRYGECDFSNICDKQIKDIQAGNGFTVILYEDGTAAGAGNSEYGQIDFGSLSGVTKISAGGAHTLALEDDSTVAAFGNNDCGQCETDDWRDIVSISAGENISAGLKNDGTVVTTVGELGWKNIVSVCAGDSFVLGLKSNGKVLIAGQSSALSEEVSSLEGIIAIDACGTHIAAVRKDGAVIDITLSGDSYVSDGVKCLGSALNTFESAKYYSGFAATSQGYVITLINDSLQVTGDMPGFDLVGFDDVIKIAVNDNTVVGITESGCLAVSGTRDSKIGYPNWSGILTVDMSDNHMVGIKENKTLAAAGDNTYGQSDVRGLKDIVYISVADTHTVAVNADGRVLAVGGNSYGQCDVEEFEDAIMADTGNYHTAAVKIDGTVTAVGKNNKGQCNVAVWEDIVSVAVGDAFTIGLKNDGTVVTAGAVKIDSSQINSIVSVGACGSTYYFLREDGKIFVNFNLQGD